MKWIAGGVAAAHGFRAAGIHAGIKRSRKPDLALVVSDRRAAAAGVFTTNRVKAAPVMVSAGRVRRGAARAVVLNSGCANCLTGQAGRRDALRISAAAARALGLAHAEVLVASTGLIGTRLPADAMVRALPGLAARASRGRHRAAARAILTTDTRPKEAAVAARIDGRLVRVGGMAKGAGMIAPSMATMLCVVTTDATVAPGLLRALLRQATRQTFNRISVDGDMSTNDSVFALANGASGVRIGQGTPGARRFAGALEAVTGRLAQAIVEDGEGASRVLEVEVVGGRTERDAEACARRVASSLLVKTMVAGADANVGRIGAAVGASGAVFDPRRVEVAINGRRLVGRGAVTALGRAAARRLMARPKVTARIHLHAGDARARRVTCDLTETYVRLNAGKRT